MRQKSVYETRVYSIQALAAALMAARQRIKALEDMARTHGMID